MFDQQRKVSAGENHLIGPAAAAFDKTPCDLARDRGVCDRLTAQEAFGEIRKARRADQRHLAIPGEIPHQRTGIVARDGARGGQHADEARPRSIQSHRGMVTAAGRAAGGRTLAVGYRLAPEDPFPAALEDAAAAYETFARAGI